MRSARSPLSLSFMGTGRADERPARNLSHVFFRICGLQSSAIAKRDRESNTIKETGMRFVLSLCGILVVTTIASAQPPEGFIPLFNGKDLDGWKATGTPKVW